MPPQTGAIASLFAPRESVAMQPGFYFAFGETLLDAQDDSQNQVRFYWSVRDTTAAALTGRVSAVLNKFHILFRMKCLSHSGLFHRLDAALVYMHRRFARLAADLLLQVHAEFGQGVGPDVPPFTRMIAPGMALAEDPGSDSMYTFASVNESFGTHRCRLLAEGILRAAALGLHTPADRLQEIERHFLRNGISFDRPYLNGGQNRDFDLPQGDS